MKLILLATFLLIISTALANMSNEEDFNTKQAHELNGTIYLPFLTSTNLIFHKFCEIE